MDWYLVKQWLSSQTGLGMDALHVHAGVLLQLLAALVLRRRLSSPWPWLVVLAFVAANEWHDYHFEVWEDRAGQREESVRDTWNTLLLPTLLLLLARFAPGFFSGPAVAAPAAAPADDSAPDPGQTGG